MVTILESIREYIGTPTFENAELLEYFFSGVLLCIVVSYVFKFLLTVFKEIF